MELTDTTQLLALIATRYVLQDACAGSFANVDLNRASVILGATSAQELLISMGARIQRPIWRKALEKLGLAEQHIEMVCQAIADQYVPWRENTFPGLLGNVISGRIANRFNFGGTNCITDAACASSFSALSMGVNELLLNQADLVISGGADTLNDIFMYMCFGKTTALSFSGNCRPFDEQSDGTLLGEGICLFALKRLQDAEANGDPIYAVIKGIGKSSDGKAKSIYAPLARGREVALNRAYQDAGYLPDSVELVEAHGTGTKAGDVEEFTALSKVFSKETPKKQWCALGSIKSQIGHTKAAAGAMGLFKIAMALRHKIYPPTINVTQPNNALNFEQSPFYLNSKSRPWIKATEQGPRRASVSSFGFGGTNFHITVEEYCNPKHVHGRLRNLLQELVLISGANKQTILDQLNLWQKDSTLTLAQLAKTSQIHFNPDEPCRASFIASANSNLAEQINKAIQCLNHPESNELTKELNLLYSETKVSGKTALLFSGQNGQRLYMGDQLAMYFDAARSVWDEVAGLEFNDSLKLHEVVFPPAAFTSQKQEEQEQRLRQIPWAQASLAAHAVSQLRVLQTLGLKTDSMVGQGVGELIALAATGQMDLATLVQTCWNNTAIKEPLASALDQINTLYKEGVRVFIELSPKKVLQKELFATLNDQSICTLSLGASEHYELLNFWLALATLSVKAGIKLDYAALWGDYAEYPDPATETHSANTVLITGSNYNKPYPPGEFEITAIDSGATDSTDKSLVEWAQKAEEKLQHLYEEFEEKIKAEQQALMKQLMPDAPQTHHTEPGIKKEEIDDFQPIPPPAPSGIISMNVKNPSPMPTHIKLSPDISFDLSEHIKKLVAEKTGFNKEIINLGMSLEADLGIDSIKRVEILAALRKEIPSLPVVEPTQLAGLSTLQEIVNAFKMINPESESAKQEPSPLAPAQLVEIEKQSPTPSDDLEKILKQIIAEKTGFSADIIKTEMSLEADLGVDSIKRVEILAGLRKLVPDLPTANPDKLVGLNTIGDIVSALRPTPFSTDNKDLPLKKKDWRTVLELVNAEAANKPLPKLLEGDVAIVAKPPDIAQELVELLKSKRIKARLIDTPTKICDVLIYLGGLQQFTNADEAIACNKDAFHYAKEVANYFNHHHGSMVFVQNTGGDFGRSSHNLDQAWSGGLSGLAKTLNIELPSCCCKIIDLNTNQLTAKQIAAQLCSELLNGDDELEIGLNGAQRIKLANSKKTSSTDPLTHINEHSVILVTGGARGITSECLLELSAHVAPIYVLLGRTQLAEEPPELKAMTDFNSLQQWFITQAQQQGQPLDLKLIRQKTAAVISSREVMQTMHLLRNNKCQVDYYPVDICDPTALQGIMQKVNAERGPVTGIIHAAGVLADKLVIEKNQEDFNRVFDTKVVGLKNLLNLITPESLKFIILFSSIAARYGNRGQSDYAMANEVLNRVAQVLHNRYPNQCQVKSLNWSPWDSGMVTDNLKLYFEQNGIEILPTLIGTKLFSDELLMNNSEDIEIILGPDNSLSFKANPC